MTAEANAERSYAEVVAARVRGRMAEQRKTQADLAAALGVSQPAVSRRLYGHVPFDVGEIVKVADFLGVPASALLPEEVPA